MSNIKMDPCPFCGGEKLKVESKRKNISYRHLSVVTKSVRCNRCHARGGTASGEVGNYSFGTPKSDKLTTEQEIETRAIELWNTRKPMDRIVEQLEGAIIKGLDKSNPASMWMNTAIRTAINIVKGVRNGS